MGKIARKFLAHYINTAPGSTAVYERLLRLPVHPDAARRASGRYPAGCDMARWLQILALLPP